MELKRFLQDRHFKHSFSSICHVTPGRGRSWKTIYLNVVVLFFNFEIILCNSHLLFFFLFLSVILKLKYFQSNGFLLKIFNIDSLLWSTSLLVFLNKTFLLLHKEYFTANSELIFHTHLWPLKANQLKRTQI